MVSSSGVYNVLTSPVSQAINKRVPIIASDAGGIPLQVKDGLNGWIVPSGNPSATAKVLMDIYTGKKSVKRDLSSDRKLKSPEADEKDAGVSKEDEGEGTDPNAVAEQFVRTFDAPVIKVASDEGSTSEDFWTVGNSVRWMLLCAQLLGLSITAKGEEGEVLRKMDVSGKMISKDEEGGNVWKMVMGDDMKKGEGEVL